jgi:hypothetical protein
MCICILTLYTFNIMFLLLCLSSYKLLDTVPVSCFMRFWSFDVKIIVASFSTVCKWHVSTFWGHVPLTCTMLVMFPLFSVGLHIWIFIAFAVCFVWSVLSWCVCVMCLHWGVMRDEYQRASATRCMSHLFYARTPPNEVIIHTVFAEWGNSAFSTVIKIWWQ